MGFSKVAIYLHQWYSRFHISKHIEDFHASDIIEVDNEFMDRYIRINNEFEVLQGELREKYANRSSNA